LGNKKSKFNKFPSIKVEGFTCRVGWKQIAREIQYRINRLSSEKIVLTVEIYPGAFEGDIFGNLNSLLKPNRVFFAGDVFKSPSEIREMTNPYLGDDPVFGVLSYLKIDDYFDPKKLSKAKEEINKIDSGVILIIGSGAVHLAEPDILVYADMARWEIQQRFRRNEIGNLGIDNKNDLPSLKYKRSFFVDWRVADRLKRELMEKWDYVLDTNDGQTPKMVAGEAVRSGLRKAARQPFELKPFFDPGPWGGQWLKEVCDLDRSAENYAWCFNCVPEENSLLLKFDGALFEIPSINLVFYQPKELLGEKVYARFGAEFPIRFDFLDTWEGGNLSLQVHPTTDYIQNTFGWHYTQDESYYLLDAKPGAKVYLGMRENIDPREMIRDLKRADSGEIDFDDEKYIQTWQVKKHDHVLIPAGTVHCSGKNCLVLEISSTPYIFTFKLWDWGRVGLDGRPRPIHIRHGEKVIQFNRTTQWTKQNLINRIEETARGDGWREERTGLHELEFIETRRHWFTKKVRHHTMGIVNVLNLVEGEEIIVESPENRFEPLIVHYAETFVVPASAGAYTVRPHGASMGKQCATIKAYVRTA